MELITNWSEVFARGGITLALLMLCSVVALAIVFERTFTLVLFLRRADRLADDVSRHLGKGALADARLRCERDTSPLAEVLLEAMSRLERAGREGVPAALERGRQRLLIDLRRHLWLLGTVGATAPFVGLFGTVVGIMEAFRAIGVQKHAGIEIVGPGIAEALVAPAAGILVAVIALVFYNAFQSRLSRVAIELRLSLEEFAEDLDDCFTRGPTRTSTPPSENA